MKIMNYEEIFLRICHPQQRWEAQKVMAKYENEGYCPCQWIKFSDETLRGLWRMIGSSVVYARESNPDTEKVDQIFSEDPIARRVLEGIVHKNVNADKILVHQPHTIAANMQAYSDIQKKLMEVKNPELILEAGSKFAVVLADADYGLDVWVWDLENCW